MSFSPHPVRGRANAAFFRLLDGYVHRLVGTRKARLFAGLPEHVVELGPGTGANLRYYRPGTRLTAVEPNPHMHGALRARAAALGIDTEILPCDAGQLPLPEGGTDAVVCTLVLCTVDDPARVLAEARRILRPGGTLLFVEHVAARPGTPTRWLQRAVRRPWRWCFEGRDVLRETEDTLTAAGFGRLTVDRFRLNSPFLPVNSQILGSATR
ncbi:methyltransferase domain-containing protein [Streptomyces sp. HC44]|uniref:Methyltransferase domain-containing protein n=2 Tax=Streptomyces scabichelini TaxID=2711217 RepID=A0A6G4VJY1_9ACTN|nr:methyltransferase domain-containing protein [Streptomyces scabichelini]